MSLRPIVALGSGPGGEPCGRLLPGLVAALATGCLVAAGCAPDGAGPPTGGPDLRLGTARAVINEDEALLAVPAGVGIDRRGVVYVLDRQDARIVAVAPDGTVRTFGQHGEGPGEFSDPRLLGVTANDLRVYDRGRRNVQVLTFDGSYREGYPVGQPGILFVTSGSFSRASTMAYSGLKLADTKGLALVVGPQGGEPAIVGDLVSEAEVVSRFVTDYVHRGEIPEFMRNHVLPMLAPNGDLWLFLQTEAGLRRYSPDGELLASSAFDVPETDAIRAEYFSWYEDWDDGVLLYLGYTVDGFATDDRVWLLWHTPPGADGLITVHGEAGELLWRLGYDLPTGPVPEVDPDLPYVPRRFLAVDFTRRIAYVADTDTSMLFALDVPAEVIR